MVTSTWFETFYRELLAELIFEQDALMANRSRLAHYTSAEGAQKIITSKSMFLRNSTCMNDFDEVFRGTREIKSFFGSDASSEFWAVLDEVDRETSTLVKNHYDGWNGDLENETYFTCLSEHVHEDDAHGRLSMWRGYGGDAGICLVMKPNVFYLQSDILHAYSYPVLYLSDDQIRSMFYSKVEILKKYKSKLKSVDRDHLVTLVASMFDTMAYCLKHPGFREEKEWRVVYRPNKARSDIIQPDVVTIRGIPQVVHRVPLRLHGAVDGLDLTLNSLLDRLIIGPSEYPQAQWRAFVTLLEDAGVSDPHLRVHTSEIPYRS